MKPKSYNQTKFKILKKGKIALVLGSFISVSTLLAAPSGGVVTSGTANITQTGNITNINQTTQKASINWQKFNIATNESVNFNQPNVNSITLNRVIGNEKSIIDGALNANGQVWIVNANGILFDKNSRVNTAGLVASTKNITNDDFNLGWYSFKGDSTNSIINLGTIDIKDEGYAILLGKEVKNEGTIKAIKGDIHLVGADEVAISLNGNSLTNLIVGKDIVDALVENKGLIKADGGKVYLTTNSLNSILSSVVNHSGIIEANSLDDISSHVEIFSHGGIANIDGKIISKDGFVETSGKYINISKDTIVKAKKWLIDPVNIIIENTGGDDLSGESINATALENNLVNTDIELQADEDIRVNEDIRWSSDKQLKLTAGDEIYLNAIIENSNPTNGGVYFNASDTRVKVLFSKNAKVIIHNPYQLQWMNRALGGNYELGSNIDASVTRTWNGGQGFDPIGFYDREKHIGYEFKGKLDGKGHIISNLYINRPSENHVGLFGFVLNSNIKNVSLIDVDIIGKDYVGGLIGDNVGAIKNSYVSGNINGSFLVGGLVGQHYGIIENSYASGSVSGSNRSVGGLTGFNYGIIKNSYASGSVSGPRHIGGLVGLNYGTIKNSYASGSVNGSNIVGGLVGSYYSGTVSNSYWDINTTGQSTSAGGGTGINSSNAFTKATYKGFDFENDWFMIEGETRPILRSEYSTTITNAHQLQLMAMDLNADYTLANDIDMSVVYNQNEIWNTEKGFSPIGSEEDSLNGEFDVNNYTLLNFDLKRPRSDYVTLSKYMQEREPNKIDAKQQSKLQAIVTNLVPTIQPPKIKAPKPQVTPPNTLAFTPKAKVNILGGGLEVPQGGMESLFSDEEN